MADKITGKDGKKKYDGFAIASLVASIYSFVNLLLFEMRSIYWTTDYDTIWSFLYKFSLMYPFEKLFYSDLGVFIGFILTIIIPLILGIFSLIRIKKNKNLGKRFAWTGIIISLIWALYLVYLMSQMKIGL